MFYSRMTPEQAGVYRQFWLELRSLVSRGQINEEEMNAKLEDRKREIQRQLNEERDQLAAREINSLAMAHDLEVWRQAYNATLTGIIADNERQDPNEYAKHTADHALADYRAKREELMK